MFSVRFSAILKIAQGLSIVTFLDPKEDQTAAGFMKQELRMEE